MIPRSELRKLSRAVKKEKLTKERGYFAVVGKKNGTVSTGTPGIIWVTVIATGQEIQVINRRYVPNRRGIVVFVGSDEQSANKTEVLFMLNTDGSTNGGTTTIISTVPPHNHSWPGENTTYVYGEQIMGLLAKPIAGTLTIRIYPGIIRKSGSTGWIYIDTQVVDVSGDVPASDALWITLQANDDGSVDYVVGSTNVARTSLDEGDIPEPTTGRAIWAVILEAGYNELFQNNVKNDFLDLRFDKGSAGTDETDPVVGAVTGIVKADGAGNISAASAGADYLAPTGDGSGLTGIDYSVVSGNDAATDVTGAELEELTDGSVTTKHSHAGTSSHYELAQDEDGNIISDENGEYLYVPVSD